MLYIDESKSNSAPHIDQEEIVVVFVIIYCDHIKCIAIIVPIIAILLH